MLSLSELQELACALPVEDRARLVRAVLDSLPDEGWGSLHPDWMAEINNRLAAFERGELDAIPAEEVFKQAYKKAS